METQNVEDDRLFIANSCMLTEGWTAETLLSSHQSLLLNPYIANTFFRAGFIEAWGRGIEKMCKACRSYGSPEPVYITHPCDLMVRFDAASSVMSFIEEDRRRAAVVTTGQKIDQKVQLTDLQQKILDFLGANPTATRKMYLSCLLELIFWKRFAKGKGRLKSLSKLAIDFYGNTWIIFLPYDVGGDGIDIMRPDSCSCAEQMQIGPSAPAVRQRPHFGVLRQQHSASVHAH